MKPAFLVAIAFATVLVSFSAANAATVIGSSPVTSTPRPLPEAFNAGAFPPASAYLPGKAEIAPPMQNAVPEPSTWIMMIAGYALVGAAMRYRGRKLNDGYY